MFHSTSQCPQNKFETSLNKCMRVDILAIVTLISKCVQIPNIDPRKKPILLQKLKFNIPTYCNNKICSETEFFKMFPRKIQWSWRMLDYSTNNNTLVHLFKPNLCSWVYRPVYLCMEDSSMPLVVLQNISPKKTETKIWV